MNLGIGKKVKELRLEKGLTLRDVSNATALSVAYLSQFERGQALFTVESLNSVAGALGVELTYFIGSPKGSGDPIVRKYQRQVDLADESNYVHYNLSNIENESAFLPRYIELLPLKSNQFETLAYPHEGEEFVYVLKGVLTLWVNHAEYSLNIGDCAHYISTLPHKWINNTPSTVQLLAINTINFYTQEKQNKE